MDAQLKRGVLPFCILKIIEKEDRYGYDIVKIIQEYFSETDESTVYAILRRLNSEGLTDTYVITVPNAPSRKYYKLSQLGEQKLNDYVSSWRQITEFMKQLGIDWV